MEFIKSSKDGPFKHTECVVQITKGWDGYFNVSISTPLFKEKSKYSNIHHAWIKLLHNIGNGPMKHQYDLNDVVYMETAWQVPTNSIFDVKKKITIKPDAIDFINQSGSISVLLKPKQDEYNEVYYRLKQMRPSLKQ